MCSKSVFLFFIFSATSTGFNIDTESPILFVDPAMNKNNYAKTFFGYSIVMNPRSDTNPTEWVRIGAPKGSDVHKTRDGLVYNCDRMTGCHAVQIPQPTSRLVSAEKGWVGATMDISHKNDVMAVCAYRRYRLYGKDRRTLGACYRSTLNSTTFEEISPLLDPSRSTRGNFFEYGQGQAGFSAHFSNRTGNVTELILGAPGVLNWVGTPFRVKYETVDSPPVNRRRDLHDMEQTVDIPKVNNHHFNGYCGYAVTSGYFYEANKLMYAATAPRANNLKGKLVIFDFDGSEYIATKETKMGELLGEYFGASMASGKINKDNLDDLVVGAPYYPGKTYNEGRVYVFLSGKGVLKSHMKLAGRSRNSQFGSSVMSLGDIDFDGYGDLAVGAPFEDENSGAVYIYGGSDKGVDENPRQIILGKQFGTQMLGFGFSISKPVDMDENHYKDLAIGAHLSGHAVLLRSRPIVVVRSELVADPVTLKLDSTSFLLRACFLYSSPFLNEKTVEISFNISLPDRAEIEHKKSFLKNLTIHEGALPTCHPVNVTIKGVNIKQLTPIKVMFSYKLNYEPTSQGAVKISDKVLENNDTLCIGCPVLDETRSSSKSSELDVPFTKDCGDDNICQSRLGITVNVEGLGQNESFVLGSKSSLEVEITLENKGENAYGTELQIVLPEVTFRQKPARCSELFTNKSAIKCSIDDPLRKNATQRLVLDLNLETNLFKLSSAKELQILITISTTSENANNFFPFKLKLRKEADIRVFGNSEQRSNYFGNSSTGTSEVIHTYKIEKNGVSPLENITAEFKIPHSFTSPSGQENTFLQLHEPIALVRNQPILCRSAFSYVSSEKPQAETEMAAAGNPAERLKRQVEVFKDVSGVSAKENVRINDEEVEFNPNKTLYLNFTSGAVKWKSIVCQFDMVEDSLATIRIGMIFNISFFSDSMGYKDTILFSTHGRVQSNDLAETETRDFRSVDIYTAFVNDLVTKKKVALWIIILSAIAGILLLALLIFLLVKARFFKRATRDELNYLKAMAAAEEEQAANNAAQELEIEEELPHPFGCDVTSSKDILCNNEGAAT